MPAPDVLGRMIPTATDATDLEAIFRRYSMSSTGLVIVGSRSEANALLAQINAAIPTGQPRIPVEVWQTDVNARYLHPNTGATSEGWEYMGGRQYAIDLRLTGTVSAGGDPVTLTPADIIRQTPGWTITGNNIVVPATGYYDADVDVDVSGAAGSLGRVFAQIRSTTGSVHKRVGTAANENHYQGMTQQALSSGNNLYVQVYHEAGGSRTYTVRLSLYMKADPRWSSS